MAVKLRLRRIGKKKQPLYRIVAIDSRAARQGRYIENLGTYNPLTNPAQIEVKEDRTLYWLRQGAIPSDTVRSFLRRKGILLKWHLMKKGFDEASIEEEFKRWEVLQLERQKRLEALVEQKRREVKEKTAAETKPEEEVKEEIIPETADKEVAVAETAEESKEQDSEKTKKQAKPPKAKDDAEVEAKAEVKEEVAQQPAAIEVGTVEESKEEVSEKKAKAAKASKKVDRKKEKQTKVSKQKDKKEVKGEAEDES